MNPAITIPEDRFLITEIATANAASIAYDEMINCLTKGDFAGFDAALRLFRKFNHSTRESGSPNKQPDSNQ